MVLKVVLNNKKRFLLFNSKEKLRRYINEKNNNIEKLKKRLFNNKIEKLSKVSLTCGYIMLISSICGTFRYIFLRGIDLKLIISFVVCILTSIFIIRKSNLILEKNRYNVSLNFVKINANINHDNQN